MISISKTKNTRVNIKYRIDRGTRETEFCSNPHSYLLASSRENSEKELLEIKLDKKFRRKRIKKVKSNKIMKISIKSFI